jgi:hypothetical protein
LSALFRGSEPAPKPSTSEEWLEAIHDLQVKQHRELRRIRTGVGITTSIVLLSFVASILAALAWGLALVGR